ncbi:MAG: tRNA (N6-isopentenyl adenosine(37)-C2)-methylthiotransferase MiaB [Propionibacteriaceae bacterium]|nr:tRNA (N6-isopentenyl adenosine(37)-C2)-methylthiotransferase MiaB [Propionibacteriaceae bacterium]
MPSEPGLVGGGDSASADQRPRTYQVITYGCQMNVHDSERIAGLLEAAGFVPVVEGATPDVVVFNTCAVRENADNRLYGNLGHWAPIKTAHPDLQIAVGGCMAQKDKDLVVTKAPWVDVVFGTHNIGHLPALLDRARVERLAQVEIAESLVTFPSNLPTHRESAYSAWVTISVGCNNTCTFCIVPSVRGSEVDRRPGEILAELEMLVDQGVQEVTLLGQNVNMYGVEFSDKDAFAKLLRACGGVSGLRRVRFASPHPAYFTDSVIAAMAETPNVMPSLHMPLQSGSNEVLRRMRRAYRRDRFLRILDDVRARIPHAAVTTDIIVGFPGETEADFEDTLDVVRQAKFAGAFTFQYSIRPGTPAGTMADQVPHQVVQERYERLVALQDEIAWEENKKLVGTEVEVMFATGEGRKDQATQRMSGRAQDNRLIHVAVGQQGSQDVVSSGDNGTTQSATTAENTEAVLPRPGDIATARITYAAPHHLLADEGYTNLIRTPGGDAWERENTAPQGVSLGMPIRRA